MKNLIMICFITALIGLITSDPAAARGGHGKGQQAGSSGGSHRHFGGGHRNFRGGHRSFGGSHRHFRGSHRHNNFNFGLNLGYYNPGYYGYRSYGYRSYYRSPFYGYPSYYPRTIVAPSTPITYIQREEVKPAQSQTNYWHYCRNPEGYYPYVKKCPAGWLRVAPQPPTQ